VNHWQDGLACSQREQINVIFTYHVLILCLSYPIQLSNFNDKKNKASVTPIILRVFSLASAHCCSNPVPDYYFHTRRIKQKPV